MLNSKREFAEKYKIRIKVDPKGCWFIKGRDWSQYTTINGIRAHRLAYEEFKGPIIPGRFICHKCDRKGCLCPGHLFQGTASDNIKDARSKGRAWDNSKRFLRCQSE